MFRKRGLSIAATALGAVAMIFATSGEADARLSIFRRARVGYNAGYSNRYYSPRVYGSGYRGYSPYGYSRYGGYGGYGGYNGYGYNGYGGGVRIGAPGVGVSVGW